jgi:hypothetical protein
MRILIESHKNAREIIEHPNFREVYHEIHQIVSACPVILFKNKAIKTKAGKSQGNEHLDVAQPLLNTYIEYQFKAAKWDVKPVVIPNANLKADFRKIHNGKAFQIEIQLGNMSRWYSDVFKFQLASIVGNTDIGISIVPTKEFSERIDSNVANYERCIRELPEIKSLLHLPILMIGIEPDENTRIINLDDFGFRILKQELDRKDIYGELKKGEYAKKIVASIIKDLDFSQINEDSEMDLEIDVENEEESPEA